MIVSGFCKSVWFLSWLVVYVVKIKLQHWIKPALLEAV